MEVEHWEIIKQTIITLRRRGEKITELRGKKMREETETEECRLFSGLVLLAGLLSEATDLPLTMRWESRDGIDKRYG